MLKKRNFSQIIKIVLVALAIVLCLVIGFYWGASKGSTTVTNISQEEKITVDSIAIVNLDAGVTVGEQKVYYGSSLITVAGEKFVQTNLKDAQEGIITGKYAAYITIPSNFSECVVSLNATPQTARIEYALNTNMDEQSLVTALCDVEAFYQSITDEISYMYTSDILSSIHVIQDGSSVIMSNDARDTAALQSIKATDLTTLVVFPELATVNTQIESIDYRSYLKLNSDVISEIEEYYQKGYSDGQNAFAEIKMNNGEIKQSYLEAINVLRDFNVTIDENNNVIFDITTSNRIKNELISYNNILDSKESDIEITLLDYEQEISEQVVAWDSVIDIYNNQTLPDDIMQSAQAIHGSWGEISAPDFIVENGQITVKSADGTVSNSILLTYTDDTQMIARMHAVCTYANELENLIENSSDLDSVKEQYQELQSNIDLTDTGCNTVDELFDTVNNTSDLGIGIDLEDCAQQLQNAADAASATPNLSVNEIASKILITKFTDESNGVTIRENMNKTAQNIEEEVALYHNPVENGEDSIISLPRVDQEKLEQAINSDIVEPIYSKEQNSELIAELNTNFTDTEEKVDLYMQQMQNYNPYTYIKEEDIQEYLDLLEKNTDGLSHQVSNYYNSCMQYVTEVESKSTQNMSNIRAAVNDANQTSQLKIDDGLAYAQSLKLETKSNNKQLLTQFISLLPYTRLGNLEYTNAYKFITAPAELVSLSDVEKIVSEPIVTIEEIPNDNIPVAVIWIMVGVLSVGIILYILMSLLKRKKEAKKTDILL